MKLNRGQTKFFGNFSIFDFASLVQGETSDALSHVRAGRDGAATTKCLELDVRDNSIVVNTNLKFHYIAATVQREGASG